MAVGMTSSPGPRSTGTVSFGKTRLNKNQGRRYGKAFTVVRRADGLLGHKYADGSIVWLEEGASNKARYREALRRSKGLKQTS